MPVLHGDLARVTANETDDSWPSLIEIVAYWNKGGGRRGKRKSIRIPADQFFGRGEYGAPLSGEQLIGLIDRLRRGNGNGTHR